MRIGHFSLAPRPHVVLRRWRLLPVDGEVVLDVGDRAAADTVVARAQGHGAMVTVNVAQQLDLRPSEVPAAMVRLVGDEVTVGEVLARTRGLWGWFRSECRAPVTGTLAAVSAHTGQILLEQPAPPLEVPAFLPGVVAEVRPRRGVLISGWGAHVPGVCGVGAERTGELVLAVRRPDAVLSAEMIGEEFRGKILVGGALVTAEALARAAEVGVVGLITGGIEAGDLDRWLGREITVADTADLSAPVTVVILGGFGRVALDRPAFALLAASEGRLACISGATRVRAGARRPEILVPLHAAPQGLVGGESAIVSELVLGCRVRLVREPHFGRTGTLARLPGQTVTLENGACCLVAEVDLDRAGGTVTVPRANLEVTGPPDSEPVGEESA